MGPVIKAEEREEADMRTKEETEFNALWFGVCLATAVVIVVLRCILGQGQ